MHEELMDQVVMPENATAAWRAVKRNGGAPGIDGMTTEQLHDHVRQHWEAMRAKLLAGTYLPSPVRRVEIPKPNGGVRLLGIPTVLDRWMGRPGKCCIVSNLPPPLELLMVEDHPADVRLTIQAQGRDGPQQGQGPSARGIPAEIVKRPAE